MNIKTSALLRMKAGLNDPVYVPPQIRLTPPALSGVLCPLRLSPKVNQHQFLTPLVILTSPKLRAGSGMTHHAYYYKSYRPGLEALGPPTYFWTQRQYHAADHGA